MITDLDLGSFFLTIVDEKDGVLYKDGNLKYYIIPNEIREMGTKHNNINCIFNIMTDKYLFFTSNQPKISDSFCLLAMSRRQREQVTWPKHLYRKVDWSKFGFFSCRNTASSIFQHGLFN